MREAFASQEISSEQRARIYTRIASNRNMGALEQMDFWGTPAILSDEPTVEDTPVTDVEDQLWLFPDFGMPVSSVESTTFSLFHNNV